MGQTRKQLARPVALVAGASRGIGRAVALHLAREGWGLALISRSNAETVAKECRALGARALVIRKDVSVLGGAEAVVDEILKSFHRLDACVHCVGDYEESSLRDLKFEAWQELFRSNLDSAFLTARAALAVMRKRRQGRIVFMGMAGISSLRPRRDCAAYAAAKTALLVYARSLALEEARNGITVNVVSPGVIPHPDAHPSAHRKSLPSKVPIGRLGKPEDVAGTVAFLLSPDASYITGADIPVTGGWMY